MGIGIETNLSLICSAFNISYKKITEEYAGMSVSEIMTKEAEAGNTLAANFDEQILKDPKKLIEFIQLNNPSNKYAILSNMNEADLDELLPFLQSDDMIMGLNFFTQDKLLELLTTLPAEQLVNVTLQMFSLEHLMALMPAKEIDKVLDKTEMKEKKSLEAECLKKLPPEILAQVIEAVTGQVAAGVGNVGLDGKVNFDKEKLYGQIDGFDKDTFQEALFCIPPAHKQMFMFEMAKEEPEILQLFSPTAFTSIIADKKQKNDIINASVVIEDEQLMQMTGQLPRELMAVVLTQLDTEDFAEVLQKNFKDVLGQLSFS